MSDLITTPASSKRRPASGVSLSQPSKPRAQGAPAAPEHAAAGRSQRQYNKKRLSDMELLRRGEVDLSPDGPPMHWWEVMLALGMKTRNLPHYYSGPGKPLKKITQPPEGHRRNRRDLWDRASVLAYREQLAREAREKYGA